MVTKKYYSSGSADGSEEESVKKAIMLPAIGKRSVGRQRIRWKDLVKRDKHKL